MTWEVAAVVLMLARPAQVGVVRARGRHPVGGDEDPVQVHVRQPGVLGRGEGLPQIKSVSGEHVDPLVQVSVDGLGADGVVGGEPGDAGAIDEPAQDQHRLGEAAQRPAAPCGYRAGAARRAAGRTGTAPSLAACRAWRSM